MLGSEWLWAAGCAGLEPERSQGWTCLSVCLSVFLSFPSFLLSFLPSFLAFLLSFPSFLFFFFLGGRCISRFLKHNACLLRGAHQELAAFLPVDPHLSTSATLFGATHPAWAALGYAGLG